MNVTLRALLFYVLEKETNIGNLPNLYIIAMSNMMPELISHNK